MSQNVILAGVGTSQVYSLTGEHILTSKTLVNSGMSFTTTLEEIRGGAGNSLQGLWGHDSGLTLTMEDSLFNLKAISLNIGKSIQVSGEAIVTEQITVATANQIEVTDTPQDFLSFGKVGYYKKATQSDDYWQKIEFTNKQATVVAEVGDVLCVKYAKTDASAEKLIVSDNFMPSQASVILTLPMFRAGSSKETEYTSASKIGELQVKVPLFMFDGTSELSLTSSGVATSSLTGRALSSQSSASCDGEGVYAEIIQVIYNKDEFADVRNIVIADSDVELGQDETQTLEVYAIYGGITAPRKIENSKLTFTSKNSGTATVGQHTGVVEGKTNGETSIEVIVTSKPELVAKCVVTVG